VFKRDIAKSTPSSQDRANEGVREGANQPGYSIKYVRAVLYKRALRQAQCKLLFMWKLYILLCNQKTFYVGITNNLGKRLTEHRSKESFFTKKFSDVRLVYSEDFNSKIQAAHREKQLKGWSHGKKEALINKSLF